MVEATGLEPAASWSQTKHSTKLSYASTQSITIISYKERIVNVLWGAWEWNFTAKMIPKTLPKICMNPPVFPHDKRKAGFYVHRLVGCIVLTYQTRKGNISIKQKADVGGNLAFQQHWRDQNGWNH